MNVYDFDKTIYDGDSSKHFFLFNYKKQPSLMRYIPRQLWAFVQYVLRRIDKTQMKDIIYTYFQGIPDIDERVAEFWEKHDDNIQLWYLKQRADDDVIISASPTFLLQPMCDQLGVHLIASEVDKKTGENLRPNCYGEEKPVRFQEHYDVDAIDMFYSDSYSDDPMAKLAKEAVLVKKDKLKPW